MQGIVALADLRPAFDGLEVVSCPHCQAEQRDRVSTKSEIAKAINYSLNRWAAFTRFLDDGRICLSNNAAERAVRGISIGRDNWTFADSDAGGHRAVAVYTLIETCKLNDVDPQAWLAHVLSF